MINILAAPPGGSGFPSQATYSPGLYHLVEYALVVAGLALLAGFVYSIATQSEVGARYRTASHASALIQIVAFGAYLALFLSWENGFTLQNGAYVPVPTSPFNGGLRYGDWTVTVPLLTVELLSVTALAGAVARRTRTLAIASAFLMIVTGFLGAYVFDNGTSNFWLQLWGWISTVFFLALYVILGRAVLASRKSLSAQSFRSLTGATVLLLSIFGAYPLLYIIGIYLGNVSNTELAAWAVVVQVGFSASDIAAKAGFGALIHKVAKLRTAEDVVSGEETHPEQIWVSSEKQADAWPSVAAAMVGDGTPRSRGGVPARTTADAAGAGAGAHAATRSAAATATVDGDEPSRLDDGNGYHRS